MTLRARSTELPPRVLPGEILLAPGVTYVASLDVGVTKGRTVLAVIHAEEGRSGRTVILDRIRR